MHLRHSRGNPPHIAERPADILLIPRNLPADLRLAVGGGVHRADIRRLPLLKAGEHLFDHQPCHRRQPEEHDDDVRPAAVPSARLPWFGGARPAILPTNGREGQANRLSKAVGDWLILRGSHRGDGRCEQNVPVPLAVGGSRLAAKQIGIVSFGASGDDTPAEQSWSPGFEPLSKRQPPERRNSARQYVISTEAEYENGLENRRKAVLYLLLTSLLCGCGSHDQGGPPWARIHGSDSGPSPKADDTPQPAGDRLHPVVEIHTSLGEIRVTLDREHAPISVDNFLAYVEHGQYDNTLIHQVLAQPRGHCRRRLRHLCSKGAAHRPSDSQRGRITA